MLGTDRQVQVSTVTFLTDLATIKGSKIKEDQNSNLFQMGKVPGQPLGHGRACKSVHGDRRSTYCWRVKGQRKSTLKTFQIWKITMVTCWARINRHAKVSMVTSSSDQPLRGQEVEGGQNLKLFKIAKITKWTCWAWKDLKAFKTLLENRLFESCPISSQVYLRASV